MAGAVTEVQVVFHNLTHSTLNDVDALVVAPTGENLVVLSDIGDPNSLAFATNATLTFSDAAAAGVPSGNVATGTYRPTNTGGAESFPAPAPAPSAQTTLGRGVHRHQSQRHVAAVHRRRQHGRCRARWPADGA